MGSAGHDTRFQMQERTRAYEHTRQESLHYIERSNARRLADAARAAGPPPSLEAQLEALSKTAQVLADRAKPHVQAMANTAQELIVKARPHLEAFTEDVASSVHSFSERAQPKLEALAGSTIEASADAAAQLESFRQWCLEQAACDIEREHVGSNNGEAVEEGVENPHAEAEAVASRGVSPVMRAVQGSELAAQQSLPPPEEEAAAAPKSLLPPPGLQFETARLLADQRQFFAQRNPTLLTNQNAGQPVYSFKPSAA